MQSTGLSRVVVPLVAMAVFAAMALEATNFRETAMWFPLYAGIAGGAISLLAVVVGAVSLWRLRGAATAGDRPEGASPSDGHDVHPPATADTDASAEATGIGVDVVTDDDSDHAMLRGFMWLALWAGYAVAVLLIGFVPASVIWVVIWFRTVVRWPWARVVIAAGVVAALLMIADTQLNMGMPAEYGLLGALLL